MPSQLKLEEYKKLPNLRLIVTPKIKELLIRSNLLNSTDISQNNKYRYLNGFRALPVDYLYKEPTLFMDIMKLRPQFITNGGIKVILPLEINTEIAYLTGLICGDGNLLRTKKNDYRVTVHNINFTLLNTAISILKKNFAYNTGIIEGHNCFVVKVDSKVIYWFFNKIMEIESGKKLNIRIPKKILYSRKLIRSFIAGFFDAEGSINLKKNGLTCQIMIYQKQVGILEEIKNELSEDGISMKLYKSHCWVLYGNKNSLISFFKNIKFLHPAKRLKLKTAIANSFLLS